MTGVFRIFFGAKGTHPFFVITCLILAGLAEAVGLMTFLPTITKLTGGPGDNSSSLNNYVIQAFELLGIAATIENMLIIVVTGLVLKAILAFAALSYVGYAVANVATGLRSELINHLMNARWAYFVDQKIGRIANVISNDATRAGNAYFTAARFVSYIVQGCVYAAIALAMSWKLALVGLGIGAVMTIVLNVLVRISKRAGRKQTDRTSDLVTYLSDTLANIKPIKAMERKKTFNALFNSKIKALRKSLRHQVVAIQGRIYAEEIIMAVCLGAGLYLAAVQWRIPVPELLIMGIILYHIVNVIGKMQKFLQSAVQFESAYWAVKKLIQEAADQIENNPGNKQPELNHGCRLENVTFSYRTDRPVLSGISIQAAAGEITVLRGTSGMGKTTLVDLLIGLYRPASGTIMIDDLSLEEIDLSAWRSMIGYVPQDCTLFHDTVLANITLGDELLTEQDVRDALAQAGAEKFVDALPDGLLSIVGERGARFSGGQRQRIALARALVSRPKLLILDEVTSALDPKTEEEICNNIKALSKGYTILAITHRPIWSKIASRLYTIEDGKAHLEPKTKRRRKVSLS